MDRTNPGVMPLLLAGILFSLLGLSVLPATARSLRLPLPRSHQFTEAVAPAGGAEKLLSAVASDTFYLYGGPGTLEGTFEDALGNPDWQGWTGHDLTQDSPHWHASQINTGNLDPAPGNWGVISHHEGNDYTGYGNNWDDRLVFRFDPSILNPSFDPSTDTTAVRLRFHYNQFTENGYDFFRVETLFGGTWQNLFSQSGGDGSAQIFDSGDLGGIVFFPGDYDSTGAIALQLRMTSDDIWSDEDGLFTTGGLGAAAIDSILVEVDGSVASVAGWEPTTGKLGDLPEGSVDGHDNGAGPGTAGWLPTPSSFAGDFSKLFSNLATQDPCRGNPSVVAGFIDNGTPPSNAPGQSTGGSLCADSGYSGYVVNYTGGLSGGKKPLNDEIWSPAIAWDLPGPDDDTGIGMVLMQYDAYYDFPLNNGIFAFWRVRSYTTAEGWGHWRNSQSYLGLDNPGWIHEGINIASYLSSFSEMESLQVALSVVDAADLFSLPGDCATIAPLYDNVSIAKLRSSGPRLSLKPMEAFQDGFPADGTLSGPVRLDMARDADPSGTFIIPGDSMVVTIEPMTPGTQLADSLHGGVLHVAHQTNPYFGLSRIAALTQLGATQWGNDPGTGWPIYTYQVEGTPATRASGTHVIGLYAFDLPDGPADINASHQSDEAPLFFPGDVLHWYVEAADDQSGVTTLPEDITGFYDFGGLSGYPQDFTQHALPTLDTQGSQVASTLIWNNNFQQGADEIYRNTLEQICWEEGVEYDIYRTRAPGERISNGLGAAHHRGATAAQLAGYERLVYLSGTFTGNTISDGSTSYPNDKSDDLGLLQNWFAQDGDRQEVFFGDNLASALAAQGSAAQAFLNYDLGVAWVANDIGPRIGGQSRPNVASTRNVPPGWFAASFSADGDCPSINTFDEITTSATGPVVSHEFLDPSGTPYFPSAPAAIWWDRQVNGRQKLSGFHPFDLSFISTSSSSPASDLETRGRVLEEILMYMGAPYSSFCIVSGVDDNQAPLRFELAQNHPNPFNPRTSIRFTAPADGNLRLRIFDARGRAVATLHDGPVKAGIRVFSWNGKDQSGRAVASGVYFYRAEGFGKNEVHKMALLR